MEENPSEIQQLIGVCPQDDILWGDLTAKEHMDLFAAFKGIQLGSTLTQAVEAVLAKVELLNRSNEFAKAYSGGMKRRLSVALSAVGQVEMILFDEPTTGLDPVSRRNVWDMINFLKKDRIVALTTHNMVISKF